MDIYQHRRHNKNLLMVHLIFVTKYRKKIVLGDFRDAVKQYLFDTCVKNHWYVKRMETDQDHVHILLQYNPTDSITRIVSILKQHSTYLSWQQHSALLEQHYWKSMFYGQTAILQRLLAPYHKQLSNDIFKTNDNIS